MGLFAYFKNSLSPYQLLKVYAKDWTQSKRHFNVNDVWIAHKV